MVYKEEFLLTAKADLVTAKSCLKGYKGSIDSSMRNLKAIKSVICFHIQQCLEKSLKYCIQVKTNSGVPRTHRIRFLIKECARNSIFPPISNNIKVYADEISDWGVNGKYSVCRLRRIDFIESILNDVEVVLRYAEKYGRRYKSRR